MSNITSPPASASKQRVSIIALALLAIGSTALCGGCTNITTLKSAAAAAPTDSQLMAPGEQDVESAKRDLLTAGDNALRTGDTEKALFEYIRALEVDDADKAIYYKIGLVHEYQGNHALAQAAFARCVQLDGNFIPAMERLGSMQLRQREYTQARKSFERAIALDHQRLAALQTDGGITADYDKQSPFYAYSGLGVIEDIEGNHHQAMVAFQVARSIKPESAFVLNNMGYSSYMANDLEVAEIMFKKAVAMDPQYKVAWRNLALVHVRRGQYEEAINILRSKVETEAAAYNTVGYLCMLDGKYNTAEVFFNKAIELAPAYFEAANENLKKNRQLYSSKSKQDSQPL